MFLNAKIHFLFQRAQKVVLKSVENHKKSSLKMYLYHTSSKIKADKLENYFFLIEAEQT